MGVFLSILKIIGIVLLSIIGFVLLLLLILLISPIHYKASAKFDGDIEVHAKVRYLLIISVPVSFVEKKLEYAAKVCGITVYPRKKKEKKAKEEEEEVVLPSQVTSENVEKLIEKAEEKKEEPKAVKEPETSTVVKTIEKPESVEKVKEDKKSDKKSKLFGKKKDDEEWAEDEEPKEPKKSFKDKIKEKLAFVLNAVHVVVEGGKNGTESVRVFLKRKSTRFTIAKVKKAVIKILLHIRPRKLSGNLEIGMDDPAVTGYISAVASLFYGYYCNTFEFTPDFTEKKLKGNVEFKGHIILGYLLIKALGLYIRKNVRVFIKNIKALMNEETENISKVKEGITDYGRD